MRQMTPPRARKPQGVREKDAGNRKMPSYVFQGPERAGKTVYKLQIWRRRASIKSI